ncbi:hypothetical protein JZ751_023718 [Albula glossodonta]|uniref:Uncharacterized protein n=1 Tax=Albula glossodonta TaxID=121402 RepID=A0A8T2MY68_9TELE|nr:hypothetical protein JZ751_023718 [Albula glossodonta]
MERSRGGRNGGSQNQSGHEHAAFRYSVKGNPVYAGFIISIAYLIKETCVAPDSHGVSHRTLYLSLIGGGIRRVCGVVRSHWSIRPERTELGGVFNERWAGLKVMQAVAFICSVRRGGSSEEAQSRCPQEISLCPCQIDIDIHR